MSAAARVRAQGLCDPRARDVHGAVRAALAIQAQDTRASRLGVRARSEGLTAADVVRACSAERSVVRTWAMRGTLHVLPAEDVRWITGLTGPVVVARTARRRADLGLDAGLCERIVAAVPAVLGGGPLTRAELVAALGDRGVAVPREGQAPAHVVLLACASGVACRGPDRPDEEPTYVLLDDWVAPEPARDRDDSLAELARRFRGAYGPSDARDLARWSGLPVGDAVRGWRRAGFAGDDRGGAAGGTGGAEGAGGAGGGAGEVGLVRLLPAFDGLLLGHRDRTPLVAPADGPALVRGTWILPSVLAGDRIAGTWTRARRRGEEVVTVTPFHDLAPATTVALTADVADLGRFLGVPATLELAGSP